MRAVFGKKIVFLVLIAVVLAMTVGGVYTAEMMTMDGGMMHNCPFMGVPALCNMSPLAHLAEWEGMFTTTAANAITALLLALALAIALVLPYIGLLLPEQVPRRRRAYRYRERTFNALQLALARGLIHSKAY